MPQDSLRSVVYRSFVPCDDPNGVVEDSTIRKSKTSSRKMERKINSRRVQKDSNPLPAFKEEKELGSKGIKEELQTHSPFQLLEVSRGAQKLNKMVDSWSKGLSFDGQSKDIARDLLKGALDLQESLMMLGKLQEASKYMSQLKRKQKSKSWQGETEVGIQRREFDQPTGKNNPVRWQKPRLSVDGSSRQCIDELKKVIRDSLSRQNLLSYTSSDEKASFDRKKSDLAWDIPSTSSSQSSLIHSNNSAPSACSFSSIIQHKKGKGPSLIAKLMGLEDRPSKPIPPPIKSFDTEKILHQRRPMFEIDMPKARKKHIADQNVDAERRTLKEIIETMQFKGLLKCDNSVELMPRNHLSSTSSLKRRLDNEIPPIVIIKPLPSPCVESEELLSKWSWKEEDALDAKYMLRNLEMKEEPPIKTIIQEDGALNSKNILRKRGAKVEPSTEKLIQGEAAKAPQEMGNILDVKQLKTMEKVSSTNLKASAPRSHKSQKKEAIKEQDKKLTMASPEKRRSTGKIVKSATASQEQAKASSTKLRKTEKASVITKNLEPQKESNLKSRHSKQPQAKNATDQMKRNKARKAKIAREPMNENLQRKEDQKEINRMYDLDSCLATTSMLAVDQLLKDDIIGVSEVQIEDCCENSWNSFCEVVPQTSEHEKVIESTEEVNQIINQKVREEKSFPTKICLKGLFLSSPSFLNCAEELFNLDVNRPTVLQTAGVQPAAMINNRLLLDCANELMECKSRQISQRRYHPLQTNLESSRITSSLDQLVEEICDGVESLRSYSKTEGDGLLRDILYKILERDLSCKPVMVSVVWDSGWMNVFSMDETDQVVVEVGKQVLGELIEEVITDIML